MIVVASSKNDTPPRPEDIRKKEYLQMLFIEALREAAEEIVQESKQKKSVSKALGKSGKKIDFDNKGMKRKK
jgi:hypothetical protein